MWLMVKVQNLYFQRPERRLQNSLQIRVSYLSHTERIGYWFPDMNILKLLKLNAKMIT